MAIADTFRNATPAPCIILKTRKDSVENDRHAPIEPIRNTIIPASSDFFTPNFPEICPAGTVNTATTRKNIVGTQFCITLFIAKSCAIAGTPMIIPFDRKTAKNDVMNDTNTTVVSRFNFIFIPHYFQLASFH